MRKLMWFTLGFGTACGLCAYLLPREWLLPAMAVGLLLALLLGIAGRKAAWLVPVALALFGSGLGVGWYQGYYHVYLDEALSLDRQEAAVQIRTSDYSYETNYGIAADGVVELDGKQYQVRAYLERQEPLEPGTVLTGLFRFRVTTADGEEDSTYHPGKGIFLLAYQAGEIEMYGSTDETFREWTSHLRRRIESSLERSFPEDTVPFAKALLLGNTNELSYKTDTDLKVSGIRHAVAVSGLHVSILFALVTALTLRKPWMTVLAGFPILFVFAAVAGFTPSVNRACMMSGLMVLALAIDRDYDRPTALSAAALVMLLYNPLVITSISFQLSVASVAGICLFDQRIRQWLTSLRKDPCERGRRKILSYWFTSSISVTLSAMSLTTPLCAVYFDMVSLVSVVTNLLTLWVISLVFYGLVAVCLLSFVWEAGASAVAWAVALPIRYVLLMAGILADFPLAAVYTQSQYICFWLVFSYLLLLGFLKSRKKQPVTLLCCGCIGLCLSLLASWTEPMLDDMRMTLLDIGQGQCILLQSQGKNYLVDCGGDSDSAAADLAAQTLLSQGITCLDGFILTHYDRDHAGGAENLLTRIPADLLILPPEHSEMTLPADQVIYADRELKLHWGDTVLHVFPAEYPGNSNEKSLAILFDTEKCDILITGDRDGFGERMLLRYHSIPNVDVLVAGHHGAEGSTCEELLTALSPETVCISAGEGNFYGHPHETLLQRLQNHGCAVYRTDRNGTILIRR